MMAWSYGGLAEYVATACHDLYRGNEAAMGARHAMAASVRSVAVARVNVLGFNVTRDGTRVGPFPWTRPAPISSSVQMYQA